jgi:two-component system response regulator CpxR
VEVKTGPNYRPTSVFANVDFELPDKVLLVDDEKEFVLTLSERLQMRDLAPAVAYNGEEALSILKEEEPEVIVLDLKMPGIDGIEVLRKVRKEHPEVEVIILTGHGSEKDRELCMQLGAFAYLEKPVDIEELSKTMKEANERIKSRRKQKS